jgi:hypothetical protein
MFKVLTEDAEKKGRRFGSDVTVLKNRSLESKIVKETLEVFEASRDYESNDDESEDDETDDESDEEDESDAEEESDEGESMLPLLSTVLLVDEVVSIPEFS